MEHVTSPDLKEDLFPNNRCFFNNSNSLSKNLAQQENKVNLISNYSRKEVKERLEWKGV
jgi:hypothetical protein